MVVAVYVEFGENFFQAGLYVPGAELVHFRRGFQEAVGVFGPGEGFFVIPYRTHHGVIAVEYGVHYRGVLAEIRFLGQIGQPGILVYVAFGGEAFGQVDAGRYS